MQDFIKLKQQLEILWAEVLRLERESPEPGPGGTTNYNELSNKPSINGVELNGNKTLTQLGIAPAATTYTKSEIDTALNGKANSADVYNKTQVDIKVAGYTAESDNGSFSSLLHSAATYCGVDDSQEVNGFVVFTSSVTSENLIGFFNFKYGRNVVFSPVISNTITYSAQSQYGTVTVTGGTGPYKAVVKFI